MLRGLDASAVQGLLPFDKMGDEYKFVILKAQQGNDGFDPTFERNMRAALARGIHVFAYCFAYPLPKLDPRAQAKLFVERLARFPEMVGKPIFLDMEWPEVEKWAKWGCTAAQIAEWMRVCCEEVERLSGVRPFIYTYDYWWKAVAKGGDVSWAARYGLWMAWYINRWPTVGEKPRIPAPWTDWVFWQFDGNNGLYLPNGVDSDFCVFNGDEEALAAVASGKVVVPTPPPAQPSLREIQARLLELGLYTGKVDGISGPKTIAAVKAFQKLHSLVVDGIPGPKTQAVLFQPVRPAHILEGAVLEDTVARP